MDIPSNVNRNVVKWLHELLMDDREAANNLVLTRRIRKAIAYLVETGDAEYYQGQLYAVIRKSHPKTESIPNSPWSAVEFDGGLPLRTSRVHYINGTAKDEDE